MKIFLASYALLSYYYILLNYKAYVFIECRCSE